MIIRFVSYVFIIIKLHKLVKDNSQISNKVIETIEIFSMTKLECETVIGKLLKKFLMKKVKPTI